MRPNFRKMGARVTKHTDPFESWGVYDDAGPLRRSECEGRLGEDISEAASGLTSGTATGSSAASVEGCRCFETLTNPTSDRSIRCASLDRRCASEWQGRFERFSGACRCNQNVVDAPRASIPGSMACVVAEDVVSRSRAVGCTSGVPPADGAGGGTTKDGRYDIENLVPGVWRS